jgi:hypothetical protein
MTKLPFTRDEYKQNLQIRLKSPPMQQPVSTGQPIASVNPTLQNIIMRDRQRRTALIPDITKRI